jgi:HSP20 family protein
MTMLTNFDSMFRDLDRLASSVLGSSQLTSRSAWAPRWMPADVFREGDTYVARFDLPGVNPQSIEVTVEKNVLTVGAERAWVPEQDSQLVMLAERPQGRFSRQLYLGEDVETDKVAASYDAGVLTVRIPVAEHAKPRKVQITSGGGAEPIAAAARD